MKIGIAGVGGIGSNVALNLVRSGISSLKIIDFDQVAPGNLNRQFYFRDQVGHLKVRMLAKNLQRIRPDVEIEIVAIRLDAVNCSSLFADCPVVVEGLDRQTDKKMLLESLAGGKQLIVSACGIAGHDLDTIQVRQMGNCFIIGDFVSDCADVPLFAHKVLAVAARMTDIILRHGGYYD
ncbi:MAG: sulfur carrier protein ThiS adenylyltransferase ThiF [Proteobacteria bacterium]|nr:sulfur carrier protein ThiS adenylyltransferase ThiF [Pseudomonadota bacterium]